MTAVTGAWATDYTTLAVGDVIKVGDTFSPTAESEGAFNDNGVENGETCTLIRADVDNDYNVTEKTDGAYYVFKSDSGWNPYIHFEKAFAVTAISDGLEVTNIENIKGKLMYTLALHESAAPVAVYGVALKSGTEDATKWQGKAGTGAYQALPLEGVAAGTAVTVKYFGTKKVESVKAVKKAVAEGHALSASVVGDIVGTDGKAYAAADKDNLPTGVTAVAMVAYKSATAGSSLAIALADEGSMNWNSAKSTCASKAAIGGKSWKLPTKDEWDQMFSANGGSTGLKTALSAAGGASSTLQNGYNWSSTEVVLDPEDDPDMAWIYSFGEGRWYWDDKVNGRQVRACLAF